MVYADKLDSHAAELHGLTRLNNVERALGKDPVLFKLAFDETKSKRSSVNRHIDLFEKICETSYVILVSVGKNDAAQLILVLYDISEIRYYEVNTEHIVVGESETAVHDEHIVAAFVEIEVLADLVESAEGDYLQRSGFPAACGARRSRRYDR